MAVDTTTVPELTAEQVPKILVQPLEAASAFLASGPRVFDSANQIRIPKLGAPTDPSWTGENVFITEADVTFDEIVLLPSTMKSVKVLTRFSNELARQSVVSLDDLHDAEGLVLAANVDPTRVRWVMTSREFVALRKIKDTTGRYIIQPDATEVGAYRLLGHTVTVTNRVPDTDATPDTGNAALVDFSQIAVARDQAPRSRCSRRRSGSTTSRPFG